MADQHYEDGRAPRARIDDATDDAGRARLELHIDAQERWSWRRRWPVLLLAGGIVLLSATAALADASGSDGNGTITVTVSSSTSVPGSGSSGSGTDTGSGSGPTCTWTALSTEAVPGLADGGPTAGTWYLVSCPFGAADFIGTTVVWVPAGSGGTTAPTTVDPSQVAAQAEASITLPDPVIGLNPPDFGVVQLPVWMWIDSSEWHSYSASATVGSVSATATATPQSVTWAMGDGTSVVCAGPGTPYDMSRPASEQSTSCSHVYQRTSAGQASTDGDPNDAAYPVTATIDWAVTWTSSVPGDTGNLPSLETSSTARLRVEQVQSVESTGSTS